MCERTERINARKGGDTLVAIKYAHTWIRTYTNAEQTCKYGPPEGTKLYGKKFLVSIAQPGVYLILLPRVRVRSFVKNAQHRKGVNKYEHTFMLVYIKESTLVYERG